MPIRKNNPNDRRAGQTPPPRTGTADSGYHDNDGDDAARPQPQRVWDFNGAGPFRQFVRDPNDRERDVAHATELARRTAEATEERRRQLAEDVRVQQERQAALQIAVDQRISAERDAARRQRRHDEQQRAIAESTRIAQEALRAEQDAATQRREDEDERQAIAESARLADEAAQCQEDFDLAIAIADSAAEAEEADRLRAVEASLEARREKVQKDFEDRQRAAEAAREVERLKAHLELKERQAAANLRAVQAAESLRLQQAEAKQREERAAQEAERQRLQLEATQALLRQQAEAKQREEQAAQKAERQRLQSEAAQRLLQQQAEDRLRKERATKAAEAAKKRQAEAEEKCALEQRVINEAAAALVRKEQQELDFALALSLVEEVEEVEVDNRPQHGLPAGKDVNPQLSAHFKRLQKSVQQREAAASLISELQEESPVDRVEDVNTDDLCSDPATSVSSRLAQGGRTLLEQTTSLLFPPRSTQSEAESHGPSNSLRAAASPAASYRNRTPLSAPVAQNGPPPTWLEHPLQSPAPSVSEDTSPARPILPELPLRGPGISFSEPIGPRLQSSLAPADLAHPGHVLNDDQAPTPKTATSVATKDSSINSPINIYGNVTINNEINISVPAEGSRSLLKRALSQSINKARGKPSGISTVTNVAWEQTGQMASLIRSGVEAGLERLNIGGSRYVTSADRALRVIDEGYETPSQTGSPTPDPSLVADLKAVQARLRTPAQSVHQARDYNNGSPASLPRQPLRVVNGSSTPSSLTPVSTGSQPTPCTRSSSSGHVSSSPANGSPSPQESVSGGSDFNDSGVGIPDAHSSPSAAAPSSRPTAGIPHHGAPVTRKPIPDHFNRPSRNLPVLPREPSASSMRVENDSPSYMTRMLGRKRVHPPVNTEWANVPAVTQDLAFTNSHAMMGANRFDDSRHDMPTLPQRTGDAVAPTIDRTITPNTKAKKAEKDAQKRLRGLM